MQRNFFCIESPAQRRYTVRTIVAAFICVLLAVATKTALRHWPLEGVALYALAALPALPFLYILWQTGVYIATEKDEFLRHLQLICLLAGAGGTLATAIVWAFLESFAHAPHLDLFWIFVVFWGFAGAAWPVARCRYSR